VRFRRDAENAFALADAFNKRVVIPLLADFSANASGAGEFVCEFKKSDSQPEFSHECKLHDRKLIVSQLYWIAGSARLRCGFDYSSDEPTLKIESFEQPDPDNLVHSWLETQLLEKYAAHMKRVSVPEQGD